MTYDLQRPDGTTETRASQHLPRVGETVVVAQTRYRVVDVEHVAVEDDTDAKPAPTVIVEMKWRSDGLE